MDRAFNQRSTKFAIHVVLSSNSSLMTQKKTEQELYSYVDCDDMPYLGQCIGVAYFRTVNYN